MVEVQASVATFFLRFEPPHLLLRVMAIVDWASPTFLISVVSESYPKQCRSDEVEMYFIIARHVVQRLRIQLTLYTASLQFICIFNWSR